MKRHGSEGFTLVELMIALAIIAIGLLGMARMQLAAIEGNAFGGRMTTAIALCQDQMEDFMNMDLEGTGAPFDPGTTPWPADGTQDTVNGTIDNPTVLGEQYNGFTVNWSVSANDPIDHCATLNVQAQGPGMRRPVSLVSVKRR